MLTNYIFGVIIITNDNIINDDNNGDYMNKKFAKIVMNPTRQRIVQCLIIKQKATVAEIAEELSDIPKPSIYRHIKTLFDNNCIEVVEETKKRGTVEKTYSLVQNPVGESPTNEDVSFLVQSSLMSIMASFTKYFANENANPQKDMLSLSSSTLMLSDEEFMQMFGEIGEVYNKYIMNKPNESRKPRNITIISAPTNDKKEA